MFVVHSGGSSTEFLGYDSGGNSLSLDSTTYKYSLLLPSTKQLVVLDTYTSVSYAAGAIYPLAQDDGRVFRPPQLYRSTRLFAWRPWLPDSSKFSRRFTRMNADQNSLYF